MDRIEDIEVALNIHTPDVDGLIVEDCRRLTGPGLIWDHAGAVIQLEFSQSESDEIVQLWQKHARRVLDDIGWADQNITARAYDGGLNLAISAPMDQLYSAMFVAQTAWHFCAAELAGGKSGDYASMLSDLLAVMKREANPPLIALIAEGAARHIEVLCDDDDISVGHGVGSQTWPAGDLPSPDEVNWDHIHNVPVAMITGTNGKTTTTRLCAAIVKASGKVAGLTSTDFVRVGDDILDRGDFSGPGGARMLLRDPRLEVACLEVARGGILRRGLPVREARVAVVTNVAEDHLGQYGVNTVAELARAKFAVHRTLSDDGVLALNADDEHVVAEAAVTKAKIWWFSLDAKSPQVLAAISGAQPCAWAENGARVFVDFAHNPHSLTAVAETVAKVPARRRFVMLGQAGDRSDRSIREITLIALSLKPDFVVAAELEGYLRGRELGEVTNVIKATCVAQGFDLEKFTIAASPTAGVAAVLPQLQPGDVALLLVLTERDEIFDMLAGWGQSDQQAMMSPGAGRA